MSIDISSRFNYEQLFRFVLPSVVMMIFISTYTMVDGFSCRIMWARRHSPRST